LSRKNILIAVAAVAVLALGGLGYYLFQRSQQGEGGAPQQESSSAAPAAGAASPGGLPAPVFLVLDKQAVVRFSKAGQDIARQMQPFVQKTQESLAGQRAALERQAAQLQANTSLSPAEREKQGAALDAKQQALQAEAQRRQQQLSTAIANANGELSKVMAQIVPAIVKERGANIVLDRAALPQADPALDITPDVIKQLDARLTTVKVSLDAK
jgi:Skp family chaperone for outer membrane proteins